ncbi:MAG: MarR family transcriptional regulator [Myxococcota bacterium]
MADENFRVELEARKAANMPQLLFKAARLLNERAIGELRERAKLPKLRASHSSLFPHIALEGTRLTDLARAMGISKQAVAQWVDELVEMGVLVRSPDPDDGRAKRIAFARGGKNLLEGLSLLAEIEGELAGRLGQQRIDALRDGLSALLAYLEETG